MNQITSEMERRYLDFCASPLRGPSEIKKDLASLVSNPNFRVMGFHSDSVLMLGTPPIILHDTKSELEHLIGEFIIFIKRQREGRSWDVDFRFENATIVPRQKAENKNQCIHPHISLDVVDYIDKPVGRLCISNGAYPIRQFIRTGRIHKAFPLLLQVLRTYHSDYPFIEVYRWPRWRKHD